MTTPRTILDVHDTVRVSPNAAGLYCGERDISLKMQP
jgi:hypothetical protein